MSYCTRIQSIVDEADKPELLPHEAASHISGCSDCRSFADERTKLQELMASGARVTVPVNFNALLNEKLSRVKARKYSWLSSVGLVRIGTATAGLAVVLLAVQFSGVFSNKPQTDSEQVAKNPAVQRNEPSRPTVIPPRETESGSPGNVVRQASNVARPAARTPRVSQRDGISIFIVRDRDRDVEVPMMPVSFGMQQQVLNSSGRQQPRSIDISY